MKKINSLKGPILMALAFFMIPGRAQGQNTADLTRKLERLKAYPDLIVVNGKIHTMDAKLTQAQAMAVKNSRILALGSNDEIRFLAGPNTEMLDAKGRTVLPGLIDGHTHPHLWAVEHWLGAEGDFTSKKYNDPQLKIVYAKGNDRAEVLRSMEGLVRQRVQELGPGKWIWVTLFGGNSIAESQAIVHPLFPPMGGASGTITREYLDTLAPNNPLIVFGSEAVAPEMHNTKAKEEMIKILGWEAGGLPLRTAVVYDIILRGRTEDKMDFVKRELLTCVAPQGITTVGNHYYGSPSIMKIYNLLYQRGELPTRWGWWLGTLWGNQQVEPRDRGDFSFFYRNLGDFQGIGNDYIWNVGVSNEAWEGRLPLEPEVICTAAKPLDPNAREGLLPSCSKPMNYDNFKGYRNIRLALESGLRIGFLHVMYDGTYDAIFHMIEGAIAEGKITADEVRALRLTTEHNPVIRPEHIPKLAKYGLMPGLTGYMVQNAANRRFLKNYGEQYMRWMSPMKSLVEAGIHVPFQTDVHLYTVPLESKDMDYPGGMDGNIWAHVEFFMTRTLPGNPTVYNRQEALDKVTVMKSATIWAAESLINEKNIGSLEVGKLADFIVIDKDYFTIPEDQIHTIKTLLTSVGGKTVFKVPNY